MDYPPNFIPQIRVNSGFFSGSFSQGFIFRTAFFRWRCFQTLDVNYGISRKLEQRACPLCVASVPHKQGCARAELRASCCGEQCPPSTLFLTRESHFSPHQVVTASLYQENVAAPRVANPPVRFPVVCCVLPLCVVLCVKSHCDLPAIAARPGGLFALSTNA